MLRGVSSLYSGPKRYVRKTCGLHVRFEHVYKCLSGVRKIGGAFGACIANQNKDYDTAIKNLKKVKRGSKVSFNHAKTGKKITGTYQGLKRMMGRSYAHVEHPKGSNHPNMIPVHHIHQAREK